MKPHTVNAFGVIKLIEMSRKQFTIFYCLVENILVILLASMNNGLKVLTKYNIIRIFLTSPKLSMII